MRENARQDKIEEAIQIFFELKADMGLLPTVGISVLTKAILYWKKKSTAEILLKNGAKFLTQGEQRSTQWRTAWAQCLPQRRRHSCRRGSSLSWRSVSRMAVQASVAQSVMIASYPLDVRVAARFLEPTRGCQCSVKKGLPESKPGVFQKRKIQIEQEREGTL